MAAPRTRLPGPDLREARTAAHRLAMAPFAFQAARAARDLGLLELLRSDDAAGIGLTELKALSPMPATALQTLLDACLAIDLVAEITPGRWRLTTIGEAWLRDPQIAIDAEFAHTVCWSGLADLTDSLAQARPIGLRHFGPWSTLYEGFAVLPEHVRRIWLAYDHGHSDSAFSSAISRLRDAAPKRVLDVGGNTGRFALALMQACPDMTVTVLDHPRMVEVARANLDAAGFSARSTCVGLDLLEHATPFPAPQDAVWMSQFLDCFAPADVIALLTRARAALAPGGSVWVLEACPDRQQEPAAAASLRLASLYFTAIANGVSRFYRASDMLALAASAGLEPAEIHDHLGTAHTLFRLKPVSAKGHDSQNR